MENPQISYKMDKMPFAVIVSIFFVATLNFILTLFIIMAGLDHTHIYSGKAAAKVQEQPDKSCFE